MNLANQLIERNAEPKRRYVELLHNFDERNPKTLATLDQLRTRLDLTPQQVQKDFEIVAEMKRLDGNLVQGEMFELNERSLVAEKAVLDGAAEFQEFQKKWRAAQVKRMQEAGAIRAAIASAGRLRNEARRRLAEIGQQRPDLFLPNEPEAGL